MIAHVNLFDKTTRCMEEDTAHEQADTTSPHNRPLLTRRASEEWSQPTSETTVIFVPEVMTKSFKDDYVCVTEVEQVEDVDDDF